MEIDGFLKSVIEQSNRAIQRDGTDYDVTEYCSAGYATL